MSTPAQITANRANAQHSSGPKTPEGKAISSRNNFQWGFCGRFTVLPCESQQEFDELKAALRNEHQPATPTETILVDKMAEHHWLTRRALRLQNAALAEADDKSFALFLRYQTTNDRAFHRCLNDLVKLRAEKRKQEIGFESQRRKNDELALRQAIEQRKQDTHRWDILLAQAKVDNQVLQNIHLETPEHRITVTPQRIIAVENAA
ncbi:MAG: hypothetical protein JOY62_16650 [Acidobacteriaceae bacterium]|nr:hypothetical protein [Acidobacteriaceae bacterium]MBV9781595.1 hypothetical protein [Acidobacteriaceae bacterium]